MINPCDFFSRAEAAPLKSPCDQKERGRERAYEQSECAKASVRPKGAWAERTSKASCAKASVRAIPRVRPEGACGYRSVSDTA